MRPDGFVGALLAGPGRGGGGPQSTGYPAGVVSSPEECTLQMWSGVRRDFQDRNFNW